MKNRIGIFLIVAACTVSAFGQKQGQAAADYGTNDSLPPLVEGQPIAGSPTLSDDDATPQNQMCIDCDVSGGGWSGGGGYQDGRYMDNPCTPVQDYVWINYQAYANGSQPDAGVNRYQFTESTTMSGMYATSGTGQSDVGYGKAYTVRHYHKVNTSDMFHVVTVINFDPASRYTSVTYETACGDGTPSSAQ